MNEKRKVPAAAVVISVLLSIVAVSVLVCVLLFMSVRVLVTKAGIKSLYESSISSELNDMADEAKLSISEAMGLNPSGIDDKDIEELMLNSVTNMLDYYCTGKGDPIDTKYYMDFVKKHEDYFEEHSDIKMTEEYYDFIEDNLDEINEELKTSYEEEMQNSEEMAILKALYSPNMILIPFIIFGVMIALIFLAYNVNIDRSLINTGVIGIVTAGLLFIVALLEVLLVKMSEGEDTAVAILSMIRNNTFLYTAICLIAGILLVVAGNSVKKTIDQSYDDGLGELNKSSQSGINLEG